MSEDRPADQHPLLAGLLFDRRSMALARVGAAIGLFACLQHRAFDLTALYADSGAFGTAALEAIPHPRPTVAPTWWSGHAAWQATVFLLTFGAGVGLLVGWRTRLMSSLAWALFTSIELRNMLTVSGADSLMSSLLLVGVFAPWGERFSLDARAGRVSAPPDDRLVFSAGALALALQAVLLFPLSTLVKNSDVWVTGDVLVIALTHDSLRVSPVGDLMASVPGLVRPLAHAALWIERLAWLLLFLPWTNRPGERGWLRWAGIALIGGMMLGIGSTLAVGPFPVVTMGMLVLFVPTAFWSTRLGRSLQRRLEMLVPPTASTAPALDPQRAFLREVPALLVVAFCASVVTTMADDEVSLPPAIPRVMTSLGLPVGWGMFADINRGLSWPLSKATTTSGEVIDVWNDGAPYDPGRPADAMDRWGGTVWGKAWASLLELGPAGGPAWDSMAGWLCRQAPTRAGQAVVEVEVQLGVAVLDDNMVYGPDAVARLGHATCASD